MKKLPPYGKQLKVVSPINLVMLYVGDPEGWIAAKADHQAGLNHSLVLPAMYKVDEYQWPVNGCHVVLIDFTMSDAQEVNKLITVLFEAGACSLNIRQPPCEQVFFYDFMDDAA